MSEPHTLFQHLSKDDLNSIKSLGTQKTFERSERIFSEGDTADYIYFIQTGWVSISLQKFTEQEEICRLGPGDYFGEMAVLYENNRTASVMAVTETTLLSVDKKAFLALVQADREFASKINTILARRNEELVFKEKLLKSTGISSKHLHISIKGDPSLRETTFTRERYESIVDKILPQLEPGLEDLLLNRSVYQIFIGFNSGEIRTLMIFDPFSEEVHQANKLTDEGYRDRHFTAISYEEKTHMLRRLYAAVAADPVFGSLPEHMKKMFINYYEHWKPITKEETVNIIVHLSALRSIPHYYLQNVTVSMARDAIRMQFNCDGTHIVSAQDYQCFIEENL